MDNKGFEYDLGGETNGYRVTEKQVYEPLTCHNYRALVAHSRTKKENERKELSTKMSS